MYGASGRLGEAVEDVELGLDEQAGRARQDAGQLEHARLFAVDDAESIGDERVPERGELAREGDPVGLDRAGLPRIETEVLEHDDLPVGEPRDGGRRRLPDGVRGEGDRAADELAEADRDRRKTVPRVRRPVRTPEVRNDHHAGALVEERIQGWQGRPHAAVVGDPAVGQRHIQIEANDDTLAPEGAERFDGA